MRASWIAGCLCAALVARAEPPPPVLPPLSPLTAPQASLSPLRLDPGDLLRVERRARYKRDVGMGLSIPGVTLIVLGAVLIGAGAHDQRLGAGAAEIASGAVSTGIGVVLMIPGALLWMGGQDDLDLARWRRLHMVAP